MRLRIPEIAPPDPDELLDKLTRKGLVSRTYCVRTITPIFGGGVEPGHADPELPARPRALHAHLRWWWRLLQSHQNNWTTEELFKREAEIWGKAAKEGDGGGWLEVRVTLCNSPVLAPYQEEVEKNGKRKSYVTKHFTKYRYALQGADAEKDDQGRVTRIKELILPGLEFKLQLTWPGAVFPECVKEAVRWWACFGGIGARWRRGLGAVQVKTQDGAAWHILPAVEQTEAKNRGGCELRLREPPLGNAEEAADKALKKLWAFRQELGLARDCRAYTPQEIQRGRIKRRKDGTYPPKPLQSFWPEANAVRDIVWGEKKIPAENRFDFENNPKHPISATGTPHWFPRVHFGMPLRIWFKDGQWKKNWAPNFELDPEEATVVPDVYERMASPLILRPMPWGDGTFCPAALLLPHERLYKKMNLAVKYVKWRPWDKRRKKPMESEWEILEPALEPREWWPPNAGQQLDPAHAEEIKPLAEWGYDPLEAFLEYFENSKQ